jgi:glycosyltransferase involved in cell wall biosynthesis
MIEAMACGTPVIAFRSGSVPEVIDKASPVSLSTTKSRLFKP